MGLILFLKKIFNKNIQCGVNLDNRFLYLFPNKNRNVHMGFNVIVKPGSALAFVVKDKITDILLEGKYQLDWGTFPKTAQRLKIHNKKKQPKKFKADMYFVNLKFLNEFMFQSNKPFIIKTHEFGKVVANSIGYCSVQVSNPLMLLETLLNGRLCVRNKEATKLISYYIGNEINNKIEKSKISFVEILKSTNVVNNYLNETMFDSLFEIGLKVVGINITSIICGRKSQQNKINNYLAQQNEYKEKNINKLVSVINLDEKFNLSGCENSNIDTESYVHVKINSNDDFKSSTWICPNCKSEASGGYCKNCGYKIN